MKNDVIAPFDLKDKILVVRGQHVMLDSDVAEIYGVETKRINEAVRNNPEKFPDGYVLTPTNQEVAGLRLKIFTSNDEEEGNLKSKISTSSCDADSQNHGGRRKPPKLFTERGLYMLATILKSERATRATISIIETYAQVRELQRDLIAMHEEADKAKQKSLMNRFGEVLTEVVMPKLQTDETETTLEMDFVIGKIKHTIKRRRTAENDKIEHEG